ncbi:hypothetical protein [Thermococcus sp. JCM 11816]|uniref:hypothetical protein n=1 Tax=Thermococcus sp. (strain JCM 11816 / KS-1) TaxID=1295125 RepID=UPI003465F50E
MLMTAVFIITGSYLIFGGSKWPKWPLKKEALIQEISLKKGERHAYILPLMKRWSVP